MTSSESVSNNRDATRDLLQLVAFSAALGLVALVLGAYILQRMNPTDGETYVFGLIIGSVAMRIMMEVVE